MRDRTVPASRVPSAALPGASRQRSRLQKRTEGHVVGDPGVKPAAQAEVPQGPLWLWPPVWTRSGVWGAGRCPHAVDLV